MDEGVRKYCMFVFSFPERFDLCLQINNAALGGSLFIPFIMLCSLNEGDSLKHTVKHTFLVILKAVILQQIHQMAKCPFQIEHPSLQKKTR